MEGQGRAGQDTTRHDKTEKARTGHDREGQNSAECYARDAPAHTRTTVRPENLTPDIFYCSFRDIIGSAEQSPSASARLVQKQEFTELKNRQFKALEEWVASRRQSSSFYRIVFVLLFSKSLWKGLR